MFLPPSPHTPQIVIMWGDRWANSAYCGNHFTYLNMYQIITLYTLNLHNSIRQLYLNEAEKCIYKNMEINYMKFN